VVIKKRIGYCVRGILTYVNLILKAIVVGEKGRKAEYAMTSIM